MNDFWREMAAYWPAWFVIGGLVGATLVQWLNDRDRERQAAEEHQ